MVGVEVVDGLQYLIQERFNMFDGKILWRIDQFVQVSVYKFKHQVNLVEVALGVGDNV